MIARAMWRMSKVCGRVADRIDRSANWWALQGWRAQRRAWRRREMAWGGEVWVPAPTEFEELQF